MKKYPSIEQFRHVIKKVREQHDYQGKDENGNHIYQHLSPYPTLTLKGTVKLHGTNAGIVKYSDGRIEYQSRERVLSLTSDNANFYATMKGVETDFFENFQFNDYCAIYGEWCGGNIQKGVALNGLPKMFVIFGVKVDDEWVDFTADLKDEQNNIYNILQFPTYNIDIDFNFPELSQNKLIELTLAVETECPVGKYFGNIGIGEGIVFSCNGLMFKSKGEKHSSSKVKTLNEVDTVSLEGVKEFVDLAVTENRLNQGLQVMKENGKELITKNTGDFIRWVVNDVLKEEEDTLLKNKLDVKVVNSQIANKARVFYLEQL